MMDEGQLACLSNLQKAGLPDSTKRAHILLLHQQYPSAYVCLKDSLVAGTKIAAFAKEMVWQGEHGIDGRKQNIARFFETLKSAQLLMLWTNSLLVIFVLWQQSSMLVHLPSIMT